MTKDQRNELRRKKNERKKAKLRRKRIKSHTRVFRTSGQMHAGIVLGMLAALSSNVSHSE
jgi:hypothetical protein